MIVTINIDDETREKDINLGFKLVNDESKFFDIKNIKKLYSTTKNQRDKWNTSFWIDVQNPANKDDVGSFEISEKTAQLIHDQLKNYLPESLLNKIVSRT